MQFERDELAAFPKQLEYFKNFGITRERLEKDVQAVKNDIAALTEQITDALNTFANSAGRQARRGYKQARQNVDSTIDDMSERGSAMMDAARDAYGSLEETLEDAVRRVSGERFERVVSSDKD